jgi:hypothetical protein
MRMGQTLHTHANDDYSGMQSAPSTRGSMLKIVPLHRFYGHENEIPPISFCKALIIKEL